MLSRWTLALGISVACLPAWSAAAEWPQFRGPGGSAVSTEKGLPAEWGPDKNVAWKAKLPGYGWSCPVVWGNKVFVTTAVSDNQPKPSGGFGPGGMGGGRPPEAVYKWEVYCLSAADGKVLWKQTAAEKKPAITANPSNGYATETPATDGERVYAYFGMTGVFCYDLDGNLVWKADLGAYRIMHGTASSPVLDGNRLFIQCDNDEKSFLVALAAKTGKELWKADRAQGTGYSTPLVWKNNVRTEVVCLGGSKVQSYDPATGKPLWELGGLSGGARASMVAGDDLCSGEEGYRQLSRNATFDDPNGFRSIGVNIFGDPSGKDKYACVFTGHHLTVRCEGNSEPDAAFGRVLSRLPPLQATVNVF